MLNTYNNSQIAANHTHLAQVEAAHALHCAQDALARLITTTTSPIEKQYYRDTMHRIGLILTGLPSGDLSDPHSQHGEG